MLMVNFSLDYFIPYRSKGLGE